MDLLPISSLFKNIFQLYLSKNFFLSVIKKQQQITTLNKIQFKKYKNNDNPNAHPRGRHARQSQFRKRRGSGTGFELRVTIPYRLLHTEEGGTPYYYKLES